VTVKTLKASECNGRRDLHVHKKMQDLEKKRLTIMYTRV